MTVAYGRWPERYVWSFQVTRLLGLADFGGSDATEIFETCQRITLGDDRSWDREWLLTAQVVEERGRNAEAVGNWISARNFYQRACNYYRCAQFFLIPDDPERVRILRKVDEMFLAAGRWFPVPPERIAIPYQGHQLPGYFFVVPNATATVVQLNGGDELSSENYFTSGSTLIEAGYNYLIWDGPGVGLTLIERGITRRVDADKYLTPAIDWLRTRPEVDPERVILLGTSFGAFDVLRAAGFEKRIAAVISSSPPYQFDWSRIMKWMTPGFRAFAPKIVGAKDEADLLRDPRFAFSLESALPTIECPALIVQGDEELLVQPEPLNQTLRAYEGIGSRHKKLVLIERNRLGGTEHCQKDNVHIEHDIVLNWLCSLGLGPAPRHARELTRSA